MCSVGLSLLVPPAEGVWEIPATANRRHRNGAVSFPDVFPCTTYGLRAEWILASRVAMQEAAQAWGRPGSSREVLLASSCSGGSGTTLGELARLNPIPGSTETCGSGALGTEVSHLMSAVAWGDVRTPQPGLNHFLKASALYHGEPGSKAKKSQQHNFLFLSHELWQSFHSHHLPDPQDLFIMIFQKSVISTRYFWRPGNMEQEIP